MKKIIYILLTAVLASSCQKADDNGDLGGFWKLLKIEEFTTATTIDTKEYKRFWSIQLDVLATSSEDDDSYSYNYGGKGRFQHIGDSLFVQMITISPSSDLKKVGLYNPKDERFGVVLLNRNKMILRSKDALLEFRKF
ncbi:MAG: lipocalin-like domain-containing protein [Bacteroidaceae bacterium]|nr:lipocalin-like domain-containing protein [Bacteroidaceae bacterium]